MRGNWKYIVLRCMFARAADMLSLYQIDINLTWLD